MENYTEGLHKQNSSEERVEIVKKVEGTPFSIISLDDGCKISIGTAIASEIVFTDEKQATEYIKGEYGTQWDLLGTLMYVITNMNKGE
ncbi:hypothetical protein [Tortoise microvirus 18]|nr:hypothetical protein [Tortoise microvirus 18]